MFECYHVSLSLYRVGMPLTCSTTQQLEIETFLVFQRYAVQMCPQSSIWSEVVSTLTCTLKNLFNNYTNPADAETDLMICIGPPVSSIFIEILAKSFNSNVELFKANSSHVLTTIERLLLMNNIKDTRVFVEQTIIVHFDSAVDIDPLLRMLIRTCPLVSVEHRKELCLHVIWYIAGKLYDVKCSKTLAPLFFDFALVLLDLSVVEAPRHARLLLEKTEFYPWKELAPRCSDLVRLCAAYDSIDEKHVISDLSYLEDILGLVGARAKANLAIVHATHGEALRAILRWLSRAENDHKRRWGRHVFNMGHKMLDLTDQRQITSDTCVDIIEALRKRVANNEEDDNHEEVRSMIGPFLYVSELLICHMHTFLLLDLSFRGWHRDCPCILSLSKSFHTTLIVN